MNAEARQLPWWRALHWQIVVALVLAAVGAAVLNATGLAGPDSAVLAVTDFVAELFLRALKMAIVPLVFATVAVGIANIDVHRLGTLGGRTLAWFLSTTSLAVITGIVLTHLIKPGRGMLIPTCATDADCPARYSCIDGGCIPQVQPPVLRDVFLGIVPTNPFASMAATYDLLGVIFFALVLGIAMSVTGEAGEPLKRVLTSFGAVVQRIVDWVLAVAPIGIFALLLEMFATTGWDTFTSLLRYTATVIGGILIHGFITLPALLVLFGLPLRRVARAMTPALLTAFSTASSSATLPVSIACATERAGVDRKTASFVLPLGATMNMDGTALYEAVAAIFIAQAWGIELSLAAQITIFITASLAAIGAPGIPSAGLVTMVIVLEAVGLPVEGIALLLAVDRFLDMFRTTLNVWGDSAGAAILSKVSGDYGRDDRDESTVSP